MPPPMRSKDRTAYGPPRQAAATRTADFRERIEPAVQRIADQMMQTGLALDIPGLTAEQEGLKSANQALRETVETLAGRAVSLDEQALRGLLYDQIGLQALRRTKAGELATDIDTLEALAEYQPLPGYLATLLKNLSLLKPIDGLLRLHDPRTGRVHTRLNPQGTVTGRITSREPCLHSLPRPLRKFVVASPGHLLVQTDYAQFELRVLALLSRDSALRDMLCAPGSDPHCETASVILGIAPESVTDAERHRGKQVNLAIINGQTPFGLAEVLGCTEREASQFLNRFWRRFSQTQAWVARVHGTATRLGSITTYFGRQRLIPEAQSQLPTCRNAGLRLAVNTLVQGTGAEIFKLSLVRLRDRLPPKCRLLLPIHDAVLLEAPIDEIQSSADDVRRLMETVLGKLAIPLPVEVGTGPTWGDCS